MPLDTADVKDVAADILKSPIESVEPVSGGLIHNTWSVASEGEEYIVQPAAEEAEYVDGLGRTVISYRLARDTEIPVPEVVSDGVESATVDGDRYRLYVAERLPGAPLENQSTPDLVARAVSILPLVHNLRSFGSAGWTVPEDDALVVTGFEAGGWNDMLQKMWEENMADLSEQLHRDTAEEASRIMSEHMDRVPTDIEPCFVHNDFSPDNILSDGERITGVLDFDFVFAGHDEWDLVKTANSFHLVTGTDRDLVYRAYADSGSLSPDFSEREPVYRVSTMLEIVASFFELASSLSVRQEANLIRHVEETVTDAVEKLEE